MREKLSVTLRQARARRAKHSKAGAEIELMIETNLPENCYVNSVLGSRAVNDQFPKAVVDDLHLLNLKGLYIRQFLAAVGSNSWWRLHFWSGSE